MQNNGMQLYLGHPLLKSSCRLAAISWVRPHMHSGGYPPVRPTPQGESAGEVFFLEKTMSRLIDETGKRFGRLMVQHMVGVTSPTRWLCVCDCGKSTIVLGTSIRAGRVRSCGCLIGEAAKSRMTKHGQSEVPEYRAWEAMKNRCFRKTYHSYQRYGGRGITVCEGWINDFSAFFAYVGPKPSKQHSLDRIDNNKNYEPGNVRWASKIEQSRNSTRTKIDFIDACAILALIRDGLSGPDVARMFGVNRNLPGIVARKKAWKDAVPLW